MRRQAWRRGIKWWLPGALLCLLNVAFLLTHRLVLAEEAELGQGLLARRSAELEQLEGSRDALAELSRAAAGTKDGLESFFSTRLATESEMLTSVIAEVKSLAERAGLAPSAIRYDKESGKRQDFVDQALDFGVSGTYSQLRQLINFLELSETFLILEEVSLRGADAEQVGRLFINLRIATLFAKSRAGEQ